MSRSIDAPLGKVSARSAAEVAARADLSPGAMKQLGDGLSPRAFLAALMRGGHEADAVRFLAHALPAREGVWWACVVAGAAPLMEAEASCLRCVEDWVYDPHEGTRARCAAAAEAAAPRGAASYAAFGAAWSGGSLAPDGMPVVPPEPRLASVGVAASVLLALGAGDPLRGPERFRNTMARGLDIAEGGNGRMAGDAPRRLAAETAA